jgi:hypothetical protein
VTGRAGKLAVGTGELRGAKERAEETGGSTAGQKDKVLHDCELLVLS